MKYLHLPKTVKGAIAISVLVLALVSTPSWVSALALLSATSYLYFKLVQAGQFNYLPLAEGAALRTPIYRHNLQAQLERQIRSNE